MNNFINVRLQAYNHTKQLNIFKHNTRKIQSLSEQDKSKTNYIVLDDGQLFDIEEDFAKDTYYNTLKKFYNNDRKEHNEKVYARRQRNLTNEQATWLEGVFTFSEAIHKDLGNKYTKEELSKVASNCLQDLAKKIGSKVKYMVLHLDETTPHFHFALNNFDDNGHSIFHKIKHKDILSKIQDLAFEHFGKLGMDRGISKEVTGKNYKTITNYYKSKQIELKAIIQSLQSDIKQIQEAKKNIKNDLDLTTSEKKQELDKLDLEIKSFRSAISEYKTIMNDNSIKLKNKEDEISAANDTLNDLNKKINIKTQEVNSFEQVLVKNEDIINNLINKNITKNIVKQDVVINLDELKKEVNNFVNKTLKIDIKTKEIDVLKQENQALKSDLKQKDDQNSVILEKLNLERNKSKALEQDKVQIAAQSQKMIQTMDKQQKALQKQIRTNTRLRKQRQRLMQKIMKDNNLTKTMQLKKHLKTIPTKNIKKDIKEVEDNMRDR